MVDIIRFLPSSYPSNISRIRNRSCEKISLPIFFSNVNHIPQHARSNIINNTKQWIGRCPGDPLRQLNIFDPPYNLQRKVLYREFSRHYPTTIDASSSIKIKQQQKNSNREPLKATTVISNSVLSNTNTTNSHLFDALSQHFTIKPEPLRSANNYINNSSNILSSWQKYWTSTNTQRQQKEVNDSNSVLYRPKREQSNLTTTHFVTLRDPSFHTNIETNSPTPTKPPSPIIPDQQVSFIQEEDQVISPREKTPLMNISKSIEEKSLSSLQNESVFINDDHEINTITTKIYKLALPSNKPKTNKPISKRGLRSKSLEKKPLLPSTFFERKETTSLPSTSVPKRRQQTLSHRSSRTKKQQPSLSTVMTTIPRSKYQQTKWDEPYIGVRYDPPTPPSSPSLFVGPQDSDTPFEQNSTNEIYF